MSKFYANFLDQVNRYFCWRNLIIFLCLIIIVLYSTHLGVNEHNVSIAQEKEFQKTSELLFSKMIDYYRYSVEGFDILSMPAASRALFASPAILSNLAANINTIVNLHIYNDCQSKAIFKSNALFQYRLSTILLILGSLLALFFNFEFLREPEYLKFIASASSEENVFASIIVPRFLLLILSYISILLLSLGMMAIKGVSLTHRDFIGLLGFLISASIMLLFFFLLGTVFGSIRKPFYAVAALLVSWLFLVLLFPCMFDAIIEEKANTITSYYKVYKEKLTIMSDFEKKAEKEKGAYIDNTPDGRKEVIEGYWNNVFPLIEQQDERLMNEITQVIKEMQNISNLTPVTFYLSTANEASGSGYQNFLNFFRYLLDLRRQFVRFWFDQVYYNDPKVMVNFVKKDENVFKAKSAVPFYFNRGVVINLGYCIILFFLSFFLYKRALCPPPKKASAFKDIAMNFVPGDLTEIKVYHKEFTTQFLNVFFGKIKHFTGKLSIDADTIVTNEKKDFLYLPPKEKIPGEIKVKKFLSFSKRLLKPSNEEFENITAGLDKAIFNKTFEKLEPIDKARVLLTAAQMKKSPVYIIDTIITGIPEEDQKIVSDIVQGLKTDDTVIINFSNETGFWTEPDVYKSIRFDGTKYFNLLK